MHRLLLTRSFQQSFNKLVDFIQTPEFLEKLNVSRHEAAKDHQVPTTQPMSTFSTEPTAPSSASTSTTSYPPLESSSSSSIAEDDADDESYVLIDRQNAIEAMAYFIAEALAKDPAASSLTPKQLQEAISVACQSMKASRFKKAMKAGVTVYRFSAIAYSCFTCYTNPWIYQAILKCIVQFSRLMIFGWGGQFGPIL